MRKIAAIWLIMAAMITSGCQTLGSLEAPEVSVTGIALNSISLFEQEWGLTLRARNPNDCLLYTSPSPRDKRQSRMPSSA